MLTSKDPLVFLPLWPYPSLRDKLKMIETEITILINRKSDIEVVRREIVASKIQFPIYLLEYEEHYQLNFTSHYEEWELDSAILRCYPDYELTSELERGRKEIRIQFSRYQSDLSTDDWGRPIENPLKETKYLVKRSNSKPVQFNPEIRVWFGADEQAYYINIVKGVNRRTDEKGFLLLNNFKKKNEGDQVQIINDRLYQTPNEAFQGGIDKMKDLVNQDFQEYVAKKKIEKSAQEKLPRNVIRNFINSCNNADYKGIVKDMSNSVVYLKRINGQQKLQGIEELEEYIKSPTQDLCAQGFKIRSSWNFDPIGTVTIGVKHYPSFRDNELGVNNAAKYRQFIFRINDGEIISITEEK